MSILGVLMYLGPAFGGLGVALGVHFGGSGGTLGRLWRAGGSKDRLPKLRPLHFKRFWSPKGAQKGSKMELKSLTNRLKNPSKFWLDFWSVSGAFLGDFGWVLGTLDPSK